MQKPERSPLPSNQGGKSTNEVKPGPQDPPPKPNLTEQDESSSVVPAKTPIAV